MSLSFSPPSAIDGDANFGFEPGAEPTGLACAWPSLVVDRRSFYAEPSPCPSVLLVTAHETERRVLGSLLRRERCILIDARSGTMALELLLSCRPDLVILDRDLGDMDGLECCRRIKTLRQSEFLPVLLVAAGISEEDEVLAIDAGADEYLSKPLHPQVFRARISALIRQKNAVDRLEEAEHILFALALTVERRDPGTGGHCQRLALYSVAFGMRLGLSKEQLLALHRGGYLHDIGKIVVPDAILYKPGKLTAEDWVVMRTHSARGEEICRPMRSLAPVLPIIRSHHERWNGSGYPDGLAGERIPLLARILQLADAFDALMSERPYKPAYTRKLTVQTLISEAGMGWRDAELTRLFIELPFDELKLAEPFVLGAEAGNDFDASVRNLQYHLAS